jgi:hypothetical protein
MINDHHGIVSIMTSYLIKIEQDRTWENQEILLWVFFNDLFLRLFLRLLLLPDDHIQIIDIKRYFCSFNI